MKTKRKADSTMKLNGYMLTPALLLASTAGYAETKLPELIYRSNAVYSVLEAAETGNDEVLAARIKEGRDVNQKDENGNTALHQAAKQGSAKCVKLLLKAGADATVTDAGGKTADQLTKSAKTRKLITKAINYRKAELNLCEQVMAGNMDLLHKNMKSPHFNPNMLDGENKLSLLMLVCAHGDADSVTRLIKAGANPNFVSTDSRSVLHKAILRNDAGIIKALLDGGADPMLRAGNQAVALHDAVWERKHESIKALLPAYKNINYSPDGGFNGTPINLAIDRNFADIVQLFIDAGIDLRDNRNGELPLVHAAITGKADCIKVLLKAGADKNARGKNGKTARESAAEPVRQLL